MRPAGGREGAVCARPVAAARALESRDGAVLGQGRGTGCRGPFGMP